MDRTTPRGYQMSAKQIKERSQYKDLSDIAFPPILDLINDLGGKLTRDNILNYFYWTPFYEQESTNEKMRNQGGTLQDYRD